MFEGSGISNDILIMILLTAVVVLLVLWVVQASQIHAMRSRLRAFMGGKNARSLENTLLFKLDLVDDLLEANSANEREIAALKRHMRGTFQKYGLVKYDALEEQGGKLSFTLALLDEKDDGIVMNMVHSREGCYCYLKEVIDGRTMQTLAAEEEEALNKALGFEMEHVERVSAKSVKALKDQLSTDEARLEARLQTRQRERERLQEGRETDTDEDAAEEGSAVADEEGIAEGGQKEADLDRDSVGKTEGIASADEIE